MLDKKYTRCYYDYIPRHRLFGKEKYMDNTEIFDNGQASAIEENGADSSAESKNGIPAREQSLDGSESSFSQAEQTYGVSDSGVVVLEIENLRKYYGDVRALDGVSFKIPEGKIIGLLGPNGSGKTTLIKIVAGLLTSDHGRVSVCGRGVGVESKSLVAYLPERNSIPEHFTVGEAVDFYADFFADFDRERAEQMLKALNVEKRYKIKSLSKGTKEKVQLVMVMSRRAKLYILDEPISGVDPAARDYIINTVINNFEQTSSVIISTHLIADIEKIMDGFIFLKYGKIACIGTPEGLQRSLGKTVDEYFREVFKC